MTPAAWLFWLSVSVLSHNPQSSNPTARIGKTVVIGTTGPDTVEFFGGLPFAQPPIGNLRFRAPVPLTTLNGSTFNATNWGAGCPQGADDSPGVLLAEDCLNLNIFRPAGTKPDAKLPVIVWIYGGDFRSGAAASYNASALVNYSATRGSPVIYVNFNYRVGSLGFPTGLEAGTKKALNLGLRDQIAALSWVQANIQAFGGDKAKVTLFGESAGAIAIADLFLNSDLEKYIRGAIFESGTMGTNRLLLPSDGQDLWTFFLSMIPQCANTSTTDNSFECLRSVPVDEIVNAQEAAVAGAVVGWTPVIDGHGGFIPELPSKLVAEGRFSRIPFISGTNLDEGTLFVDPSVNTTNALRSYIASQLPGISDPVQLNSTINRMLELYPDIPSLGSPFGTGNDTFGLSNEWKRAAAISCDVNFAGVRRGFTQFASKYGVKTYAYLFTDPQLNSGFLGIPHATELSYVYGVPIVDFVGPASPEAFEALSPVIMDYWLSFASALDPNDGKGVERANWEQFTPARQALIQLHSNNVTMIPDDFRVDPIAFINTNSPAFGH
ncbi:extracellular triacylglycerol lipase precursor [Mycena alexandri]|uniref:Carboxylic ester hydrolase n=1 Tax=Mycena alexandri TaxID=1745969 RepID=A0AAD6S8J7_9AGAR|nr:extracellular triacylglycerol lipase precursor [Mycena alexandri]